METRWLEAFIAVAEEQHFGRAAERLHMAQSPLSQVIRRLEAELEVTLFERSTRHVSITAAGSAFLPRAYGLLKELELATEAARNATGAVRGRLRIGFSGAHNHLTLPKLTRGIRREYPDIELELVAGVRTVDGLDAVRRGHLDISFIGVTVTPDPPLRSRAVLRTTMAAIVPADHRLAGRESIDARELRNEDFVMALRDGSSSLTETIMRVCGAAGFHPRVTQELSDPYLVPTLVSAGMGVTLATTEMRDILPGGAVWVPLAGEPVEFIHGIAWSTEHRSPVLDAALAVADEVLPEPGPEDRLG